MLYSVRRRLDKWAILSRIAEATGGALRRPKLHTPKPLALIVDDDPDVAPLVSFALSRYEISSEDVHDGAAALARLRERHYDLVILDLTMAGLNGFDVLRALKNEELLRAIPVIVLTSHTNDESLARSFGYGADDFVSKPFKPSDLAMRAYRLIYPLPRL